MKNVFYTIIFLGLVVQGMLEHNSFHFFTPLTPIEDYQNISEKDNPFNIIVISGKYMSMVSIDTIPKLMDGEVYNPLTGRIWMDKNLGASRVAISPTDDEAHGDLFQWGRAADGHEKRDSPTTTISSNPDSPGHGSFIMARRSPFDWLSSPDNNLWQDNNGTQNPCPQSFRLPTEAEWETERLSWGTNDADGAFASALKLTMGGYRGRSAGSLNFVGTGGYYWSSSVGGSFARYLNFSSSDASTTNYYRATGSSVRCIKD